MSKKSGAQSGEGKLESRFAALTSGLLARKGQAAPSNSPIVDPAEETEAFTLSDALIPRRKDAGAKGKGPTLSPLSIAPRAAPAPAPPVQPASAHPAPSAVLKSPAKAVPASVPVAPAPPAPKPAAKVAPAPITVINERSLEAGYPDNPSAEEIEALDAEADEVASYFENFGGDAVEAGALFFDDDPAPSTSSDPLRDPLDDLDDGFADAAPVAAPAGAQGAEKSAAPAPVRATVSAGLDPRAFMRLALGAAELGTTAEALIAEAIEEYLDARGIDSLGGEDFLKRLAAAKAGADDA